ncbi:alpha-galactosidase [Halobacillus fulvus]|nr:alpha-galactosidase [Halobacillus fulvus]
MIRINEESKQFHLTNGTISYIFHIMKNGQPGHLYYGKALRHQDDFSHFQTYENVAPNTTHPFEGDPGFSLETVKQEFPVYGKGDYREAAVLIEGEQGQLISDFEYTSYQVEKGKSALSGLPSSYAADDQAETLRIQMIDPFSKVEVELVYTIFSDDPVIARSCRIKNSGEETVQIKRLMSLSLDLPEADYDMLHLSGAWARERHLQRKRLSPGIHQVSSQRGASSHQQNPFLALKRTTATEQTGEVMGLHFVYSGNFVAQAEVDHYDTTRLQMGIHPTRFEWNLSPEDSFQSPEVLLTYSDQGLNGLSQAAHRLIHDHLIAKRWVKKERPVLINNWEATYFDFNEQKLDKFAAEAKELGIELFVLDDGWFGKRNDDTTSLGDWFVDKEKLPNGIGALAEKVKAKGLQFGLWFEPEMISPESELIEQHPEWVVGMPDRPHTLGRNQLVLDFSNPEVVDYLFERMSSIIEETKLDYIKWDMNRNITEPFSKTGTAPGEFFHRYLLGVYELYDRLTTNYPDVLFESCAGGGGRFDLGMMYYAPQAWASDDTDAVERLKIQYGTSIAYPLSTIGSHVSAVPNHQTLRETALKFRADVAYFGTFGYELDPSQLTEEEKAEVKKQIKTYKQVQPLIQSGTFYRLSSPFDQSETAWMLWDEEKREGVVGWYKPIFYPNPKNNQTLKLRGLSESASYEVAGLNRTFYGDELMQRGLPLGIEFNGANTGSIDRGGDQQSHVYFIKEL